MSILTAQCTSVPIGILEIEGMMDENGAFYVEINNVSRFIGWEVSDIESTLEVQTGDYLVSLVVESRHINAISLDNFAFLLGMASTAINPSIMDLLDSLQAMALLHLFSDAFTPQVHPITRKVCKGTPVSIQKISVQKFCPSVANDSNAHQKAVPLYVYLITDRSHDICKIGITRNPNKRLQGLQSGYPFPLVLEQEIKHPSSFAIEQWIHSRFDRARVSGEWFTLSSVEPVSLKAFVKEWEATAQDGAA